ncbi:hypothetical protein J3B02_002709, partial [Coemansia erecta]
MAKQQKRRPSTVVSFHSLNNNKESENDAALIEEIARNRVCLASFGLSYMAVVIINRALADDPETENRLRAIMQKGGLDAGQFLVCRPGTAQQFQAFLGDLGQKLFAKAAVYYAEKFMRVQSKMAKIPQLPVSSRMDVPGALYQWAVNTEDGGSTGLQPGSPMSSSGPIQSVTGLLSDSSVVSRFSRYLPLRAWLVRYHFKMAMFAEALSDLDTAHRCLWLCYVHLISYVSEISSGAYLPPDNNHTRVTDGSGAPVGWMWLLNGGDSDGTRAHSLRMFGRRWDEAMELLGAVHLRLVRGWMYQSIEAASIRLKRTAGGSGGWPYGFGSGANQQISAVNRSGIRAVGRPAVSVSPGGVSSSAQSTGVLANSVVGGNGSLEPLVLSVHAGECTAATEQMMDLERRRRRRRYQQMHSKECLSVCFVALGSESADVDLVLPEASAHEHNDSVASGWWWWWWPLGGHFGVCDLARPMEPSKPGLLINSTQETSGASSMLPATHQYDYDVFLTLAARQCSEHVVALACIMKRAGFGEKSSYFWATVQSQYSGHAELQILAGENGLAFGRALDAALTHMTADTVTGTGVQTQPGVKNSIDQVVRALRQPVPTLFVDRGDAQKSVVEWESGRPSAVSSAFMGFAFDKSLEGIFDEVSRDESPVGSVSYGRNAGTHDRNSLDAGTTGGTRDLVFPYWMWSANAAPFLRYAAQAALRRFRAFHAEKLVYMSNGRPSVQGHLFSAYPGVENTYVSVWLVAERSRHESKDIGHLVIQMLVKALGCVGQSESGRSKAPIVNEVAKQEDPLDHLALQKLIVEYRGSRDAEYLHLISEMAEVYAEIGEHTKALSLFSGLAQRYRAKGWTHLTAHALQWIVKCASFVDDHSSKIQAMLELLSPQLVVSETERKQIQTGLLAMLEDHGGCGQIQVGMHAIYSPITCHAHWRHWQLDKDSQMKYQIVFDCQALQLPMPVAELHVEFSDSRFDMRIASGETGSVESAKLVDFASSNETASYLHFDSEADSKEFDLCLQPGRLAVFEGAVVLDDGYLEQRPIGDLLAIQSVTATVGTTGSNGWKLRMFWPTCAKPGEAQVRDSDNIPIEHVRPDENDLSTMERRLLANIGIARMHNHPALGESSQLAVDTSIGGPGHLALRRAIRLNGPAASLPQNRSWLCVSPNGIGRWVQLSMPPLMPRRHRVSGENMLSSHESVWREPVFSMYSRCRALCLPEPAPFVALSAPSTAQLAPALRGEVFPVELNIVNLHQKKPIVRVSLEIGVAELGLGDDRMPDAVSIMDSVSSGAPSAGASAHASMINLAANTAATGSGGAESGLGIGQKRNRSTARPWLSVSENDIGGRDKRERDLVIVDLAEIASGQSLLSTVYVHFPEPALASASKSRSSGGGVALVKITARYTHAHTTENSQGQQQWWTGSASLQISIPVVSPLHVQMEQLPSHIAAPRKVPLQMSTSMPAIRLAGDSGEYCLRRPILVSLYNDGPWDIAVERMALRPPLTNVSGFRVQLAESTAMDSDGQKTVVVAGSFVQHVFWLDIFTSDLVRLPEDICAGTLEVLWHRKYGQRNLGTVFTRMWMRPMRLVQKQVQVESESNLSVARVGQPMTIFYRILNPTRETRIVETAMHASENFVFAGPRRSLLNILPGHVALLRFNLVPIAAVAQPPASLVYSPGQVVFGLKQQLAMLNVQGKPMPPSNVAGQGWVLLPKLDVKLVDRHVSSSSSGGLL